MFGSSEIAKLVASLPKYDVSVLDMRLALIELNSGKDITLFEANRILRVFGHLKPSRRQALFPLSASTAAAITVTRPP